MSNGIGPEERYMRLLQRGSVRRGAATLDIAPSVLGAGMVQHTGESATINLPGDAPFQLGVGDRTAPESAHEDLFYSAPEMEQRVLDSQGRIVRARISSQSLDGHGTVILPGGANLSHWKKNPVVLWDHELVIGQGFPDRIRQTQDYIDVEWQMLKFNNPKSEIGLLVEEYLWPLVEQRLLRGYSVGFPFATAQYEFPEASQVRGPGHWLTFTKWDLREFSLTGVPSNPEALGRSGSDMLRKLTSLYKRSVSEATDARKFFAGASPSEPDQDSQSELDEEALQQAAYDAVREKVNEIQARRQVRGVVTGLQVRGGKDWRTKRELRASGNSNYLPHLAAKIFDRPLAIQREKLEVILSVLSERIGLTDSFKMIHSDPSEREQRSFEVTNGVGVIPVHGTLVQRSFGLMALSGLSSYSRLERMFNEALRDDEVEAIALDIDSPGGEVNGLFDFADTIFEARGEKPIWAIVNENAFSAAYAIASAADKVVIPRTGGVGSVGVVALHVDQSERDKAEGLTYTYIFSGDHKVDGNPHEPLSEEAEDEIQTQVDQIYDLFVSTVARNRGISEQAVRDTEARVFFGQDALASGLADEIASVRNAFGALAEAPSLVAIEAEQDQEDEE